MPESMAIQSYEKLYYLHLKKREAQETLERTLAEYESQIEELTAQAENYFPEGQNPEKWLQFAPSIYGRIIGGDFHFYKA